MSLEAMVWALEEAPDVPAECVAALMGLANHADSRGRGAYAGQKLVAEYGRKSDRAIRNDLTKLADCGLIRRGDQSLAAHIPADCRPVVFDLAMERKRASGRKSATARKLASAASGDRFNDESSDLQEHRGNGSTLPGGSGVQRERKHASYKPTTNPKNSPTESSQGGVGAEPLFDAETKPAKQRRANPETDPDFDRWYKTYPVHKARGDAEKAWGQVMRAGADPEVLITAAERYREDPQVERGYGKFPAGWLRAKCWLDEPARTPDPAANGHKPYRNPTDQSVYDDPMFPAQEEAR